VRPGVALRIRSAARSRTGGSPPSPAIRPGHSARPFSPGHSKLGSALNAAPSLQAASPLTVRWVGPGGRSADSLAGLLRDRRQPSEPGHSTQAGQSKPGPATGPGPSLHPAPALPAASRPPARSVRVLGAALRDFFGRRPFQKQVAAHRVQPPAQPADRTIPSSSAARTSPTAPAFPESDHPPSPNLLDCCPLLQARRLPGTAIDHPMTPADASSRGVGSHQASGRGDDAGGSAAPRRRGDSGTTPTPMDLQAAGARPDGGLRPSDGGCLDPRLGGSMQPLGWGIGPGRGASVR
jgi:hypothetical protein